MMSHAVAVCSLLDRTPHHGGRGSSPTGWKLLAPDRFGALDAGVRARFDLRGTIAASSRYRSPPLWPATEERNR